MKELSLSKMESIEGGLEPWQEAVGCGAGIALVILGAGGANFFAFAVGVDAIFDYC